MDTRILLFFSIYSWTLVPCYSNPKFGDQNMTTAEVIQILFQNYSDRVRPDVDYKRPTPIRFNIYINSISSVNEISMDLTINIFLRQWWADHRLQYPEKYGQISLNPKDIVKMWVADIYFPHEKEAKSHSITVPNQLVFLEPNGSVYFSQRLTIRLSCAMDLKYYPFDVQTCPMDIEPYASKTTSVLFDWTGSPRVEVDPKVSLPEYSLNRTIATKNCTKTYISGTYPCLSFKLELERMIGYFLIQNYIPSVLIVILSWVSFWIDIHAVPARISLGLLTVLTMTTQISGIHSRLPRVSYIKAIDVWLTSCMVFVFGALIEFSIVNVLARQDEKRRMAAMRKQKAMEVTNLRNIVEEMSGVEDHQETVVKFGSRKGNGAVHPNEVNVGGMSDRSNEAKKKEKEGGTALLADKVSRVVFPLAFLIFNIIYWVAYSLLNKSH